MKKRLITVITSIVVAFSTMLNIVPIQDMTVVKADSEQKEAIDGIKKYIKRNGEYNKEFKYYYLAIPQWQEKFHPYVALEIDSKDELVITYFSSEKQVYDEEKNETSYNQDFVDFNIRNKNKITIWVNGQTKGYATKATINLDEYDGEQGQIKYNKFWIWELGDGTPKVSKIYAKKDSVKLLNDSLKKINKSLKKYTDYSLYDLGFENY